MGEVNLDKYKETIHTWLMVDEEIDTIRVADNNWLIMTQMRVLFAKERHDELNLLYDSMLLINRWKPAEIWGECEDNDVWLHYAIAFWTEQTDYWKTYKALEEFIMAISNKSNKTSLEINRKIGSLFPVDYEAYLLLGAVYRKLNMRKEAKGAYEEFAKVFYDNQKIYAGSKEIWMQQKDENLGFFYLFLDEYEQAENCFKSAIDFLKIRGIEIDEEFEELRGYYTLVQGMLKWQDGKFKEAHMSLITAKALLEDRRGFTEMIDQLINSLCQEKYSDGKIDIVYNKNVSSIFSLTFSYEQQAKFLFGPPLKSDLEEQKRAELSSSEPILTEILRKIDKLRKLFEERGLDQTKIPQNVKEFLLWLTEDLSFPPGIQNIRSFFKKYWLWLGILCKKRTYLWFLVWLSIFFSIIFLIIITASKLPEIISSIKDSILKLILAIKKLWVNYL